MVAEYTGRVSREQRYTDDDPCPGCGGYDSRKLGSARCWGIHTSNGRGFICTVASSSHPAHNGDGWVHLYTGCDCGADHSDGYRLDFTPSRVSDAPVKITQAHKRETPDAIHDYGAARLLRYGSGKEKRLCWQHFDRDYGWIDRLGDVTPGFYRAEEIAAADPRRPVYLAGGEKCVDALVKAGAIAGCNPGGENGQWRAEWSALLQGRHVVILADADDKGRKHAQAIADSLAGVASSVRIIELEGAHDVADWLADGHDYGELLEITACSLPVQNSNPALQDGRPPRTQKTCIECDSLKEQLQIAETSLANLRREQAMTARILALPNDKLAAPVKLAAVAVRQILAQPKARNEEGEEQVYRAEIARQCGVSDQTAGAHLRKLQKAGVIHRRIEKSFDNSQIFISEGDLFNAPEAIPTPERANTWGGKHVKKGCPHCKSIDIVPTSYGCNNCGAHMRPDELIDIEVQDETQETSLPPDMRVNDLAPDGDELVCPECGRAGDMLHDYGDGLRCRACDVLAVTP